LDEFDLIERYFGTRAATGEGVVAGIGDDAAVLQVPGGRQLVVTTDTMVGDVHFFNDASPVSIGHKLAAVNLSDIAAMGGKPEWALLTLTLPQVDESWLEGFASGLHGLLVKYGVSLVGGDTTRGPLSVGLQLIGTVPEGRALYRSGAVPGEIVCVSGTIGGAALALAIEQGRASVDDINMIELENCLNRPEPRVKLGQGLRGIATACIDISDGLAADIAHIAAASSVGMEVRLEAVPLADAYRSYLAAGGGWNLAVSGGDDYELCFTLPESRLSEAMELGEQTGDRITPVGRVTKAREVIMLGPDGSQYKPDTTGYNHFEE
jgi:thiamine-monophosphate kinase